MKKFLILITIFVVAILVLNSYHHYNELDSAKMLYQDSISYYKDKLGHVYSALEIHQLKIKDLNDSLQREAKNHKDPIYITRTKIQIQNDTILKLVADTVIQNDSIYSIHSFYKDDYLRVDETIISRDSASYATLDSLSITADIYNDIILKNDKYYNVVRTNNPYVKITGQESAFIQDKIKKPKKWGAIVGIGAGISINGKFYPYLGVMFGYRLF